MSDNVNNQGKSAEKPFRVVLASASPRRRELLEQAGVSFTVHASEVDESLEPDLLANPPEACKKLAERVRADSIAVVGGDEFADSPVDPKLYCISALTGKGVDSLKAAIATKVHELREEARAKAAEQPEFDHVWEHKREMRDRRFTVRKLSDGVFRVEGGQVERMVIQTDWENEDAIAFLQHRFDRCGLDLHLAKAGAVNGDEIRILGFAFTYEGEDADDEYSEVNEVEEELFADSDDAKGQE